MILFLVFCQRLVFYSTPATYAETACLCRTESEFIIHVFFSVFCQRLVFYSTPATYAEAAYLCRENGGYIYTPTSFDDLQGKIIQGMGQYLLNEHK